MRVLVTGSAGFIGAELVLKLLARGDEVFGLDDFNDYYDVGLKRARVARFAQHPKFQQHELTLSDRDAVAEAFERTRPTHVVNLAAQAGVRHASRNPHVYVASNVTGFLHVLEGCRALAVKHLVFASSSSVYGANGKMPFSEHDGTEHPISLYAATKKANEMMAHSYAHLYGIPSTGLRFFTVYGPWGRPDMATFLFARAILQGEPIKVFNGGDHQRDFTYVDDIVEGVIRVLERPPGADKQWDAQAADPATSTAPYRLYNIGNQQSVNLRYFIEVMEQLLGKKAVLEMLPMQPGDVANTEADVSDLARDFGYRPTTSVEEGLSRFVRWFRDYYQM